MEAFRYKWDEMNVSDIKLKQYTMKLEYEAIKVLISQQLDRLDELDKEFIKSEIELNKRVKEINNGH